MEEIKRKRRTHAEVVAAREAYAAERHRVKQEREAKRQERAKKLEERAKKREQKTTREKTSRAYKADQDIGSINYSRLPTYEGNVEVGDRVAAKFAGAIIVGHVISIDYSTHISARGTETIKYYTVDGHDGYKYPIQRHRIIAKEEK